MRNLCAFLTILFFQTFNSAEANPMWAFEFDGEKAFKHLETQTRMGPRIPGRSAHRKCSDYIVRQLESTSCTVQVQRFEAANALKKRKYLYENIIGFFDTPSTNAIVLSTHWDTRVYADQDTKVANRQKTVPGANGGASGVAVLLELARVFEKHPPKYDVYFLFLDASEVGLAGKSSTHSMGAKYFISNQPEDFIFFIGAHLELVGGVKINIPIERNSLNTAQEYARDLWGIAVESFPDVFEKRIEDAYESDHMVFVNKGLPYLFVGDPAYKYWHTVDDTTENCSEESLDVVGKALALWVLTALEKK